MSAPPARRRGLRAAPWLLWFAVLGGGLAWSLHTLVDWGLDETVCRSGNSELLGLPLRPVLGVLTLVFLAVCVASAVLAFTLWRRLRGADGGDEAEGGGLMALRRRRAAFMAQVGFVADLLFTAMVLFGGIAVLVFPACAS